MACLGKLLSQATFQAGPPAAVWQVPLSMVFHLACGTDLGLVGAKAYH